MTRDIPYTSNIHLPYLSHPSTLFPFFSFVFLSLPFSSFSFQVQRSKSELLKYWNLPFGKKILLYVGRISLEKNPQYFVDVLSHLSDEWIGVFVGPLYYQEYMPTITDKDKARLYFVGMFPLLFPFTMGPFSL